jgi:DMSO/TMAO reductase YedYZ molybdopterin-dependent catalytic subunit
MMTRRGLLEAAGGAFWASGTRSLIAAQGAPNGAGEALLSPLLPAGARAEAVLESLPGKKPLIKLAYRPPNYESPLAYLRDPITPNEEFFVRYHLADIPAVDASHWKLSLGGEGASSALQIGLAELQKLPAAEVTAVCECAGNRRGLLTPHTAGVQWGHGAIGCARWRGPRLKDVLDLVGLKKDAVEIVFDGADAPVFDRTPDFVKSLPVWKAIEETTLIAYEMNGQPLPHWNGFPARIVVPGWAATYWVKHVTAITAVIKPFGGYWMREAYRIPVRRVPLIERFSSQETATSTPVTEIPVNSLITSPTDGTRVKAGRQVEIKGLAWDGGYGIRSVEISADSGKTWTEARLGDDLGVFAFRPWSYDFLPKAHGKLSLWARATNRIGQTQNQGWVPNPSGYYSNIIQTVSLHVI